MTAMERNLLLNEILSLEMLESSIDRENSKLKSYTGRSKQTNKFEPYRIQGGLYTAKEKAFAAFHPRGLVLTVPGNYGKEERRLSGRAPGTIQVRKEMVRFEDGKLGAYVQNFNEFTFYLDEVLRHIGRLRDLLSLGAPEAPTDLNALQKSALRPTDDFGRTIILKDHYKLWREAQNSFAITDSEGNLTGGRAYEVIKTSRDFNKARQAFWEILGELRRIITEAKRLKKPTIDLDIKLNDIGDMIKGNPLPLVDLIIEARSKRQEYDAKMKDLKDIMKNLNLDLIDKHEALRNAGEVFWSARDAHNRALVEHDKARTNARDHAARFGQTLLLRLPHVEKRNKIAADIRMPILVADAWRTLANFGSQAFKKLNSLLASRPLLERAKFHYAKPDPFGVEDITYLLKSYNQAYSWRDVLTKDDIEEWVAINKLWDEIFIKFYR